MTALDSITAPARKAWTDEEIKNLPHDEFSYEIVDAELAMSPKNNPEHSNICVIFCVHLHVFVRPRRLGRVFESNAGFWMKNQNLRAPDVSFISAERLKGISKRKFFQGAPDLVIEVLSSTNRPGEIQKRLRDFFENGTKLAWVIDPETKSAEVYRSPNHKTHIPPGGILDGEDVLPGFTLPLKELFEDWD